MNFSANKLNRIVLTLICFIEALGCSPKMIEPSAESAALSPVEISLVSDYQKNGVETVPVLFVKNGKITKKIIQTSLVVDEANSFVNQNQDGIVVLDLPVDADLSDLAMGLNDNFSGKEEFGLAEWNAKHPLADGRNVTIAVVDDGVSLKRPGLLLTSEGKPKIKTFINTNSRWNVELTDPVENNFILTRCGFKRPTDHLIKVCHQLGDFFPDNFTERTVKVIYANSKFTISIDGMPDLEPLSQNSLSMVSLDDASAWGFDVVDEFFQVGNARVVKKVLHVKTPEHAAVPSGKNFIATGSHGEGVAGISAGYKIANRNLNGVAPGAQIVDVHFTDSTGYQAYTIGSVVQALLLAGEHADVVNLSYSLYFNSPAAQVAMGKLMDAVLAPTSAFYVFSAGNNGPGINSMNRSLLYPSFSLPVAAFLNGRLSQTTFGAPSPFAAVAPYSSVGPGIDGGGGALVLSPLAGIVPSTANEGFRPFSGTSSATPAMAGFVSRLLGQIRAEGLSENRNVLREAILRSSRPIPEASFIEQGMGIPHLESALIHYRALIANNQAYKMFIVGNANVQGIKSRGIYVRDPALLEPNYSFTLGVEPFQKKTTEELGQFSDLLTIVKTKPWVKVTDKLFMGKGGVAFQVSVDASLLVEGLNTADIEITSASGAKIVLPITIIKPIQTPYFSTNIEVKEGTVFRYFWKAPVGAKNVWISRATTAPTLCGRSGVYTPSGIRDGATVETQKITPSYEEKLLKISEDGIYELDIEGRMNHQSCAGDTKQRVVLLAMGDAEIQSEGLVSTKLDWSLHIDAQDINTQVLNGRRVSAELNDPFNRESAVLSLEDETSFRYKLEWPNGVLDKTNIQIIPFDSFLKSGLIRYPAWDMVYWDNAGFLDANSAISGPVASGYFEMHRFETGLTNVPKVRQISAEVRTRIAGEANSKISLGTFDPLKNPKGTIDMNGLPMNRSYNCTFKPLVFTLSASCGVIDY